MFYKLEHLKRLIKSMTGPEKRHFSLSHPALNTQGKNPFYLQIFQALSKSETDLPEFPDDVSPQVYTIGKKRLFKNIMKNLRTFHEHASIEITLQTYLSEIEILYNHSLPEQSLYILNKAYKIAVAFEKYALLLQILDWEGKLNVILDSPRRTIEAIAEEEQEVLFKLNQILQLENICNQTRNMKKAYGYVTGKLKKEMEQATIHAPGMIGYEECASQKARFYFSFVHAMYYRITFNHRKAYSYSQGFLNPQMQIIAPNDYINGILEHIASSLDLVKFDEAFATLEILQKYIQEQKLDQSHALNVKIFYYQVSFRLIMYNYMGDVLQLKHTIKTAEEKMIFYEEKLSAEMKLVLYGNLMNAYLGVGDTQKMDLTWDKIFHKTSKTIRHDIHGDLYLFRLFSLLQSKVYDVLPSVALSAHRYYNQSRDHQLHFGLEIKITTILIKEYNFEHIKVKNEVLNKLKQIITQHIQALKEWNNFQEHYSRYIIWIDSLINDTPFQQEAALWYKNHLKNHPV